MKVLLLGNKDSDDCKKLYQYLVEKEDEVLFLEDKVSPVIFKNFSPDIIVSYNYRYILKKEIFSQPPLGSINLHIAYLPWNRGADPNFWSHFENTPKGVTIHYIDEGIDTGDIIVQEKIRFSKKDTLKTSYEKLHKKILTLFEHYWHLIRKGKAPRIKQKRNGALHFKKDREAFEYLLKDKGWNTLIKDLSKIHLKS